MRQPSYFPLQDEHQTSRTRNKSSRRAETASDQSFTRKVSRSRRSRKKKEVTRKTEINDRSYHLGTGTSQNYGEVSMPTSSTLPRTGITPPTQPTPTTLPRTSTSQVTQPTQPRPTTLPRPPRPPRKPSGYVSPAASLKRHSKMDRFKEQYKGLNIKTLGSLPEILKIN